MSGTVVDLLRDLVRVPSPSGSEAEVASLAVEHLTAAGVACEDVDGSVLARLELGPVPSNGPALLLNTHLDTVPVGEGWTRDPFGAEEVDGRIHGRGANDAKASVAAMIQAVSTLATQASSRADARGTLWLALTVEEETQNAGMAAILERLGAVDAAVTGEPTGLEVVRAQSGLGVIVAEWFGKSCHAAHVARVEHDNALLRAAAEIGAVAPFLTLPDVHPLLGPSTITPTVLEAGERSNVVPDHAQAIFDARLAPPYDALAAVAALATRLPTAELSIRSDRLGPVETDAAHPLVIAALHCAGREHAIGSSTLSDMALLRGVPAIKCGPGETVRSHTPDEFVLAHEVEAGAAFYAALVPRVLASLTPSPTS